MYVHTCSTYAIPKRYVCTCTWYTCTYTYVVVTWCAMAIVHVYHGTTKWHTCNGMAIVLKYVYHGMAILYHGTRVPLVHVPWYSSTRQYNVNRRTFCYPSRQLIRAGIYLAGPAIVNAIVNYHGTIFGTMVLRGTCVAIPLVRVYHGTMVRTRVCTRVPRWYHWYHGTMVLEYHGIRGTSTRVPLYVHVYSLVPWYSRVPWYHGTTVPLVPGTSTGTRGRTMVPVVHVYHYGTMVRTRIPTRYSVPWYHWYHGMVRTYVHVTL
jgi:hypothetical protein